MEPVRLRQLATMRKIEELEKNLNIKIQENTDLIPKMEMMRDGDKKKEREEYEI